MWSTHKLSTVRLDFVQIKSKVPVRLFFFLFFFSFFYHFLKLFSLKTEEVWWFVDIQLNLTERVFSRAAGPGLSLLLSPQYVCLFVFFFFKSQLRLRRHTTQRQKDPVRVCVSAGAETWPNTQRFQDRSCWPLCGELVLKHTHAHTRAHTHTHTHTHTQTFENLSSKEAFLWTLLYWMYCWL